MKDPYHSIFRSDAVHRYIQRQEKAVLPQLVAPRTFAYLWFLLGVFTVSSLSACFIRVPVYASGSAAIIRLNDELNDQTDRGDQSPDQKIAIVAFFPPQHLSSLRTAQNVFLSFDALGDRLNRSIITVESKISSPDAVQKRFALNTPIVNQPTVVAIAQLETIPENLSASAYVGSVGYAEAEVGAQPVMALVPLIGQFFEP